MLTCVNSLLTVKKNVGRYDKVKNEVDDLLNRLGYSYNNEEQCNSNKINYKINK